MGHKSEQILRIVSLGYVFSFGIKQTSLRKIAIVVDFKV